MMNLLLLPDFFNIPLDYIQYNEEMQRKGLSFLKPSVIDFINHFYLSCQNGLDEDEEIIVLFIKLLSQEKQRFEQLSTN